MKTTKLKTREQVIAEFKAAGITIAEWARSNGFHRMTVVDLLRGARKGLYGETYRCAVALGLRSGEVVDVADFKPVSDAQERREKARRREQERREKARRDHERRVGAAT